MTGLQTRSSGGENTRHLLHTVRYIGYNITTTPQAKRIFLLVGTKNNLIIGKIYGCLINFSLDSL